jgi:hypothetical protein
MAEVPNCGSHKKDTSNPIQTNIYATALIKLNSYKNLFTYNE